MINCVSDDKVILAVQGIRNVTWGESNYLGASNPGKPWFITVTYKGSFNTFYYRTEAEARYIFGLVRVAMDKSFGAKKEE